MLDFKTLVRCESEEDESCYTEIYLCSFTPSGHLPVQFDTNNYTELWHLLLKRDYLRLMRKQRVDILIHILVDEVKLDLRQEEVQITLGCDVSHLQKSEKAAYRLAYAIELRELEAIIENYEDDT